MRRGGRGGPPPSPRRLFRRPMAIVAIKQFGNGETYPVCPGAGSPWSRSTRIFVTAAGRRWIGGSMPMRDPVGIWGCEGTL